LLRTDRLSELYLRKKGEKAALASHSIAHSHHQSALTKELEEASSLNSVVSEVLKLSASIGVN